MSSKHFTRSLIATLCFTMAVGPLQAMAGEQTVRCESRGHRYNYCRVDTDNQVEISQQLSHASCDRDRSWGYDREGVWVDRGCSAEFRVGHEEGHKNDHPRTKAIAIGAAILGAVALGTLAMRNHNAQQQESAAPAIEPGSYSGYDATEHVRLSLELDANGQGSARAGSGNVGVTLEGDQLQIGRHQFSVQSTGNGFIATDVQNPSHRVNFQQAGNAAPAYSY